VIGGGPVGVELGQMMSRYGARVTIVEGAERLLAREDESVGHSLAELLRAEGIELRLGTQAKRAAQAGDEISVELESGERLTAERLLIAVGRKPRVDGIGLDAVGIAPGKGGAIEVDEHCQAGDGVWAVGDVTGVAPFTHVAAYQASVAGAHILGDPRPADYRAVPRVVFCDPEVAAVGLTPAGARERGLRTTSASIDLSDVDRTETYGRDLTGHLGVLADVDRGVLVGAWAVGPLASEWIHSLVVAVRAEVPIAVLRDTIMQFPTFSEAIAGAVSRLRL
jgi:pyruvate/2-oxoglutarate dehydrogenase complex dihydrolipoamide dehydrogenase (E3) component